jgi:hypothetical protein
MKNKLFACSIFTTNPANGVETAEAAYSSRGGDLKRSQRDDSLLRNFSGFKDIKETEMSKGKRRHHSAEFKARVALEAIKGIMTVPARGGLTF